MVATIVVTGLAGALSCGVVMAVGEGARAQAWLALLVLYVPLWAETKALHRWFPPKPAVET